ncbi:MAG: hypothetical protein R3B09_30975 [Nannocystaceae bacterium]
MSRTILLPLLALACALTLTTACDQGVEPDEAATARSLAGADGFDLTADACDVLAQDCDDGDKCVLTADESGAYSLRSTICAPVDDLAAAPGAACRIVDGIADTCAAGTMCVAEGPRSHLGTCAAILLAPMNLPCSAVPDGTFMIHDGQLVICGQNGPKGG